MGITKKNQPALQVKKNGEWKWVFCYNERFGVITTENRRKALRGVNALDYFQNKYAQEFRLEKDGEKYEPN